MSPTVAPCYTETNGIGDPGVPPAGSYDGAMIGERFRIGTASTVLTRTASVAPIGFTRIRSETGHVRAKDVPFDRTGRHDGL